MSESKKEWKELMKEKNKKEKLRNYVHILKIRKSIYENKNYKNKDVSRAKSRLIRKKLRKKKYWEESTSIERTKKERKKERKNRINETKK